MKLYEMLEKLESVGGSIAKEDLLRQMLKECPEAHNYFCFTFNDTVYGIQEKSFFNAFDLEPGNWESASDFLYSHTKRKEDTEGAMVFQQIDLLYRMARELVTLSGQAQLDFIYHKFSQLNPLQAKWWCRALLHDLRAGAGLKTLNSVFKSMGLQQIEKFSLQLAKKFDIDDPKDIAKIKFPCSMETKYDGIRVQAHVWVGEEETDQDGNVIKEWEMQCQLTSRRGTDRTHLHPEICEELKSRFIGQNVILDGEVIASSFQSLTRKDDTSVRRYIIFDILNDELLPYQNRWDNLRNLLDSVGITDNLFKLNIKYNKESLASADTNLSNSSDILLIAEHYNCNNLEELREFYREMNRRKEEGVIIKLDNQPYERGSRKNMFKLKKVYTADLKIIGYKLGEGKRAGKVSTLELQDASGKLRVDVGSGIDDWTCEDLTKQLRDNPINLEHPVVKTYDVPTFIGKICEIKYNELTETGSIRFPRFVCIREDKDEADNMQDL